MMREVRLRGPIHLVAGRGLNEKLHAKRGDHPKLPTGVDQILHDIGRRPGGVSATIRDWEGRTSLLLYTYDYVVKLDVTKDQDAYWVNAVWPRGLRATADLSRCCLLVRARWRGTVRAVDVPDGSSAHWQELAGEWERLEAELADRDEVPRIQPQHKQFLNLLATVNDAAREADAEQTAADKGFLYRQVAAAGGQRSAEGSAYVFHLVQDAPRRGAEVQLGKESETRGRVVHVDGKEVTVQFDQPLDWSRVPQQGVLVNAEVAVVHAMRRKTVHTLRARSGQHGSLLEVLVDNAVQPIPPTSAEPVNELDPEQLTAFRKALTVPDLLVVLGPPGTGKTRVITEMAQAVALTGGQRKTLVSSYANRAVDNVLARLVHVAEPVTVIRIGEPAKVDPEVRPYLLEEYASTLREEIVRGTRNGLERYRKLPKARPWHGQLGHRIVAWQQCLTAEQLRRRELEQCRRVAGGPAQHRVDACSARVQQLEKRLHRRRTRLARLRERARRRAPVPALQGFLGMIAALRDRRIGALETGVENSGRLLAEAGAELSTATDELNAIVRDVPEVVGAQRALDDAAADVTAARKSALTTMTNLRATIAAVEPVPDVTDSGDDETTLKWLGDLHAALDARIAVLENKHALLTQWHEEVANGPAKQLYPELIRYADVIGATCIGSASRSEIAAEEFDLVIVDEAGQVQTSDVVIPLVRGKRAVLVGDHKQLPPVSKDEVESKVAGKPSAEAMLDLLRKSTLEMLVERLPAEHVVRLRKQRRMPGIIADLVSDVFYQGTLQTMVRREPRDAIFQSTLAFVDTSCLPTHVRGEQIVRKGVRNRLEADLLSRLAAYYQHHEADWALIVPYRHQLSLVRELLGKRIQDQDTLDANTGTVDAFQGGERDVVLYGFTRSNEQGEIGFLDELRRLNVALTRAKRQLVLVGDLETLRKAKHPESAQLIEALHESLKSGGDLRTCIDVFDRLGELEP